MLDFCARHPAQDWRALSFPGRDPEEAMLAISVSLDVAAMEQRLAEMHRKQLPFAASQALNDTAKGIAVQINADMPKIFDRPTPFTSRAVVAPPSLGARKDSLAAMVTLRPVQAQYLRLEEVGGTRSPAENTRKVASALVLPGKADLDSYGNLPSGYLARISRQAKSDQSRRTAAKAAKLQAAKARKRKSQKLDRDSGIVYLKGGDPRNSRGEGGFFARLPGHKLQRLTGFQAETHYQPHFHFHDRVLKIAAALFNQAFPLRLAQAIASAKP